MSMGNWMKEMVQRLTEISERERAILEAASDAAKEAARTFEVTPTESWPVTEQVFEGYAPLTDAEVAMLQEIRDALKMDGQHNPPPDEPETWRDRPPML
jgi:hypothetical protein